MGRKNRDKEKACTDTGSIRNGAGEKTGVNINGRTGSRKDAGTARGGGKGSGKSRRDGRGQEAERKKRKEKRISAQQSIPYREMARDGICRVQDKYYSKTIRFYDINYQLAQNEIGRAHV